MLYKFMKGYEKMEKNFIKECKENIEKAINTNIKAFKIEDRICKDNLVATVKYENKKWKFEEENILPNERISNFNSVDVGVKKNKRIIIILESPHKDEYSKGIIAPAMGKTGKNIKDYLLKILDKKIENPKDNEKKYDVILMNAIQYQTSLGIDTEYFRDRVWLTLWNKGDLRKEFIKRLEGYDADIIFNFCTNGSHEKDLIYILDKKTNSSMTFQYIDSLNLNIKRKEDNNLYIDKEVICKVQSEGNSNVYLLKEFVQTTIEESNLLSSNIKIFKGPHPSSWISKDSKKDEKSSTDKNKESFIDKIEFIK